MAPQMEHFQSLDCVASFFRSSGVQSSDPSAPSPLEGRKEMSASSISLRQDVHGVCPCVTRQLATGQLVKRHNTAAHEGGCHTTNLTRVLNDDRAGSGTTPAQYRLHTAADPIILHKTKLSAPDGPRRLPAFRVVARHRQADLRIQLKSTVWCQEIDGGRGHWVVVRQ